MSNYKQNSSICLDFPVSSSNENYIASYATVCEKGLLNGIMHDIMPFSRISDRKIALLDEVNKNLLNATVKLPIREYPTSQHPKKVSPFHFSVANAWCIMQDMCYVVDICARQSQSRFYRERKVSPLRPTAFGDTFPSMVVFFGSDLIKQKDFSVWNDFYKGYMALAELRIGIMWHVYKSTTTAKSMIRTGDADKLVELVLSVKKILADMQMDFAGEPFNEEKRNLFREYLADELTCQAIAGTCNPSGNWVFYSLRGDFPQNFEKDWKFNLDRFNLENL